MNIFDSFFSCYRFRISMETAGLPIPGYHYIAPNHIVKAPIHWMIHTHISFSDKWTNKWQKKKKYENQQLKQWMKQTRTNKQTKNAHCLLTICATQHHQRPFISANHYIFFLSSWIDRFICDISSVCVYHWTI